MKKYTQYLNMPLLLGLILTLFGCSAVNIKESSFLKDEEQAVLYHLTLSGEQSVSDLSRTTAYDESKLLKRLKKLQKKKYVKENNGVWTIDEGYRKQSHEFIQAIQNFRLDKEKALAKPYLLDIYNIPQTKVEIAAFIHPNPEFTLLIFGGSGFNLIPDIQEISRNMLFDKTNVFVMNYPGMGCNTDEMSIKNIERYSKVFFDYIKYHEKTKNTKFILYGFSLGGFVAANIASSNYVEGLILDSTAPDIHSWIDENVPVLAKPFIDIRVDSNLSTVSNVDALKSVKSSILLICGAKDKITPSYFMNKLEFASVNAKETRKIILDGVGHGETPDHPKFKYIIENFIKQL